MSRKIPRGTGTAQHTALAVENERHRRRTTHCRAVRPSPGRLVIAVGGEEPGCSSC
ncbi:hypothetical protein WME75_29685 [Sorangium sp. So ce1014]|uniref:hypothetical protein n=1 Tax=Sorangium sp. So ce1014 TaxID=3133326 RepID=UPI003F627F52